MKQVVFVCSGNYYRSRFAEHLFNCLASQVNLPWQADSRGLLLDVCGNLGPISQHAVDDLDCAGPEEALPLLEENVRELVVHLGAGDPERLGG